MLQSVGVCMCALQAVAVEQPHLSNHLLCQSFELGAVGVLICIFKHLVSDPYGAGVKPLDPDVFPDCRTTKTRLKTRKHADLIRNHHVY